MISYTIKSKKQANGLWGTPITLTQYIIKDRLSSINHELLSAILIIYAENNNNNTFKVEVGRTQFTIRDNNSIGKIYNYSNYGLIDNILYYISGNEDRLLFNRILKLKKIKCQIKNSLKDK
jgi:hypothetical protein